MAKRIVEVVPSLFGLRLRTVAPSIIIRVINSLDHGQVGQCLAC